MKDIKLVHTLHILIILSILSSCLSINSDINFIIDASLNGTCSIAVLDIMESDQVYFSYDFEFHSNFTKINKDYAMFEIYSIGNNLLKDHPIYYGFVEKSWMDIENSAEIKNINWTRVISKDNIVTIKRTNDKMKTLLFRISKKGYNKGLIWACNIFDTYI